jgi:hypothetical protein
MFDDFATTDIGLNFDETWKHAQGYPGVESPNIKEWFKEHTVVAGNFVAACPEPTVQQVLKALAVQKAFLQVLDTPGAEKAPQHRR